MDGMQTQRMEDMAFAAAAGAGNKEECLGGGFSIDAPAELVPENLPSPILVIVLLELCLEIAEDASWTGRGGFMIGAAHSCSGG
jgi:hypothetical protein